LKKTGPGLPDDRPQSCNGSKSHPNGENNSHDRFSGAGVLQVPAGEANVAFAFRDTSPGNRWWWAVDEVRISGDP
jgi:hypothetical protein